MLDVLLLFPLNSQASFCTEIQNVHEPRRHQLGKETKYDITKLWNFEVILIACNSLALSLSLSLSILCLSSCVLWVLDFSPLHTSFCLQSSLLFLEPYIPSDSS